MQDFQSRAETGFIFLFCFVFVFVFVFWFVFVFMKALPIADCQGGRLLARFPVASRGGAESEQRRSLEGLSVSNKRPLSPRFCPTNFPKGSRCFFVILQSYHNSRNPTTRMRNSCSSVLVFFTKNLDHFSSFLDFFLKFWYFQKIYSFLKIIRFTKTMMFGKESSYL